MPRITATMMMLCIALFGSTAHGSSLRGVYPTTSARGVWKCFMTNGIATETLSYGFKATTGSSSSSTLKLAATAAVKQTFKYGVPGIAGGATSVDLSLSVAHSWSNAVSKSQTKSETTTVSTACQAEFCPTEGKAHNVNICQWTVSGTVKGQGKFTLASKSILFAPAGKKPNCPINAALPGTWCDTAYDSWCSRCTATICEQNPDLPGCVWFKGSPYRLGSREYVPKDNVVIATNNKAQRRTTNALIHVSVPGEWIAYSTQNKRWESGNSQKAYDFIEGKDGLYPPEGTWKAILASGGKENGHECTYNADCVSGKCVSDSYGPLHIVAIYHCRACWNGGTACLPTPKPTAPGVGIIVPNHN